jgi:hypothetical protein
MKKLFTLIALALTISSASASILSCGNEPWCARQGFGGHYGPRERVSATIVRKVYQAGLIRELSKKGTLDQVLGLLSYHPKVAAVKNYARPYISNILTAANDIVNCMDSERDAN